jgi:hypothetical protein
VTAEKLVELRDQRAELEVTRTREDLRAVGEQWLATVLSRVNGSTGFVLNLHAGPEEIQAVVTEFLLPGVRESILAACEAKAELTAKDKDAKLAALDKQIAAAEKAAREEAKAAALAEVEARFGGVAA